MPFVSVKSLWSQTILIFALIRLNEFPLSPESEILEFLGTGAWFSEAPVERRPTNAHGSFSCWCLLFYPLVPKAFLCCCVPVTSFVLLVGLLFMDSKRPQSAQLWVCSTFLNKDELFLFLPALPKHHDLNPWS